MSTKAIGLIHLDHSLSASTDERLLIELARTRGLLLAHTLTINSETFMPTALIVQTAHHHRASIILAPTLGHFGVSPKAVALTCTLIVPDLTIPASGSWKPNH